MFLLVAVSMLLSTAVAAEADIYSYSCKVDRKTDLIRVDDTKNTLEWNGKKYALTSADCGRVGWHAVGNGAAFDFCTATQGYGDIEIDGNIMASCDLKRR